MFVHPRLRSSVLVSLLGLSACGVQPETSQLQRPSADEQEAAIADLGRFHDAADGRDFAVRFDPTSGLATSIRGALSIPVHTGATDEEYARLALELSADLLGRVDIEQLIADGARESEFGSRILRFQQTVEGVPVYGATASVSIDGGRITSILARLSPEAPVGARVRSSAEAEEAAQAVAAARGEVHGDASVSAVVWDGTRFGRPHPQGLRAAWLVVWDEVSAVVDAESGELLRWVDERHEAAFTTQVQDHVSDSDLSGNLLYQSDPFLMSPSCGSTCAASIFFNYAIYSHWENEHGYLSFDNQDSLMWTLIDGQHNNANARLYSCSNTSSGICAFTQYDEDFHAYDIFAHEWNHMFDKFSSDLEYQDAAGALDEALADLKGAYLDGNWTVGEDSNRGAFRDMSNPPRYGNPDHMDDYEVDVAGSGCTPLSAAPAGWTVALPANEDDNGCVHSNSGIIEKAVYLMVDGGVHTGVTVAGQGWSRIEPLLWDTQLVRLDEQADFDAFRDHLELSCAAAHGAGDATCHAIHDAFRAVGIGGTVNADRGSSSFVTGGLLAADLDGDGGAELIAGAPWLDGYGLSLAGAVAVWSSDGAQAQSVADSWTQVHFGGEASSENFFGTALATGDFDSDGDLDVAIGAPGTARAGRWEAGEVCWMLNDGGGGFEDAGCIGQTGGTSPEADDYAGGALAAGDFDCDGSDDLAVGAAMEDWGSIVDTGAVTVHYSGGIEPGAAGAAALTQSTAGTTNETDDRFGEALVTGDFDGDGCDDLAVGVPFETNDFDTEAGAVVVFYGSTSGLGADSQLLMPEDFGWNGDSYLHFGWALAAGDWNDDGTDDLAIGVPDRSVSGKSAAGSVVVYEGVASGNLVAGDILSQSPGSSAEAGDRFGASLAAGDSDSDGIDDLVIGSATEDFNSTVQSGLVQLRTGGGGGLSSPVSIWSRDVLGAAVERDWWGESVAVGPLFNGRGGVAATATGTEEGTVCAVPTSSTDTEFCVE